MPSMRYTVFFLSHLFVSLKILSLPPPAPSSSPFFSSPSPAPSSPHMPLIRYTVFTCISLLLSLPSSPHMPSGYRHGCHCRPHPAQVHRHHGAAGQGGRGRGVPGVCMHALPRLFLPPHSHHQGPTRVPLRPGGGGVLGAGLRSKYWWEGLGGALAACTHSHTHKHTHMHTDTQSHIHTHTYAHRIFLVKVASFTYRICS